MQITSYNKFEPNILAGLSKPKEKAVGRHTPEDKEVAVV